jgi:hypothetical protein
MITHEELTQKLYETYMAQVLRERDFTLPEWDERDLIYKRIWSAVADAAWELVEGENAIWAEAASRKEEELRELVVEFMNRAEVLIG